MATLADMAVKSLQGIPGVFTYAQAAASGISNRSLAGMCAAGTVERLARGIYIQAEIDIDPDLAEIAVRSPRATLCLTTMLARHDLTDDIPASINVAVPRTDRPPAAKAPVTWHRFDNATFDIGRTAIELTEQLSIGAYDPMRSIIDAYRLRHLYGVDQAHEALKRWLRQRGSQPAALLAMSGHFPKAEPALRAALEILL